MFLFLWILFLADSRKFYPLIFADGFHFSRIFFISRGFSQILFADFRGCFFMFFFCGFHFSQILADFIRGFLRVSFLADSRGFYSRIFADFISRRLSQILSADFRGWFSFLADFFYVFILLMFILFLADVILCFYFCGFHFSLILANFMR